MCVHACVCACIRGVCAYMVSVCVCMHVRKYEFVCMYDNHSLKSL